MTALALAFVLLAALTHATWNFFAKSAVASRHFVWLYSTGAVLLYFPVVAWVLLTERPQFTTPHWLALGATSVLHLAYSLMLQAGYRASDLSLVYPIARGTGPLLSFVGAVIVLEELPTPLSIAGMTFIVIGILLVAGLTSEPHKAPRAGIVYGLLTGVCIAAYTVNDGWAVKVLLLSPFLVDFTGNFVRMLVLTPIAWRDRTRVAYEVRAFARPALVVSVLGPLGYILVLFAMRMAPVSHVAPARELATLVGTYLGSKLLREESGSRRVLGALCIVVGVVSLAFAPTH